MTNCRCVPGASVGLRCRFLRYRLSFVFVIVGFLRLHISPALADATRRLVGVFFPTEPAAEDIDSGAAMAIL